MKFKICKAFLALTVAVALCVSLAGCGSIKKLLSEDTTAMPTDTEKKVQATPGGSLALPAEIVISQEPNTITNQLVGEQFAGGVTSISYRVSSYFYINGGSATMTANFALYDKTGKAAVTEKTDATVALWEKGATQATYVETVHFVADGTTQTYTFNNLKPDTEYRIGITYTDKVAYRMSGSFSISPVSGTGPEETQSDPKAQ